ncbi:transcription repressor OFP7-like [Humulus lupulus]|uniref:transcription repressor OFP7-like n=1 Tax=Humulus lupulus TaxID=3486 RepID=UPI002B413942|nr:transcription repressor OFP7-like [Humulus lupulus]
MSSNKSKKPLKTIFMTNGVCGCAKLKLCDVLEPIRKPKIQVKKNTKKCLHYSTATSSSHQTNGVVSILSEYDNENSSATTTTTTPTTSTTVENTSSSFSDQPSSVETDDPGQKSRSKRLNDTCIAVVKETSDPYEDFKQSMKQMIVEKEIYANQDLQELLSCFLELNSPSHGDVIVRAFTEIWNDVVPKKPSLQKHDITESVEQDIQS